jgi:hypothetical protein
MHNRKQQNPAMHIPGIFHGAIIRVNRYQHDGGSQAVQLRFSENLQHSRECENGTSYQ